MITEDFLVGEYIRACFYCGSSNIETIDMGTLIKHKCNVCKKTGIFQKRLDKPIQQKYPTRTNNRKPIILHRKVMESILKRKLFKDELVHHIDLNKKNYSRDNLINCSSQEHANIHSNLNKLITKLINDKIIKFDKEKKQYFY